MIASSCVSEAGLGCCTYDIHGTMVYRHRVIIDSSHSTPQFTISDQSLSAVNLLNITAYPLPYSDITSV